MWSRNPFRAVLLLAFWAAGLLSCHLEPEEAVFLDVQADSSWLALDSVTVLLQDSAGDTLEVLRHGPLDSLEELEGLESRTFSGLRTVLVLVAYDEGLIVRRETRAYDGRTQATTDRVVEEDLAVLNPGRVTRLDLDPDSLRLYSGGAPARVSIVRGLDGRPGASAPLWFTTDDNVATVADGWVTPKAPGTAAIIASSLVSIRSDAREPIGEEWVEIADTVVVRVVADPPILTLSKDTTIVAPASLAFRVKVDQEHGGIAAFKWDLDGDDAWDDSLQGLTDSRAVLLTDVRRFTEEGEFLLRFLVRDGEGNEVSAARRLTVRSELRRPTVPLADAGPDTTVSAGSLVTLRGSATDSDGDILTWEWRSVGSPVVLATTRDYTFQAAAAGTQYFILKVTDAEGLADEDTVRVTTRLVVPFEPPVILTITAQGGPHVEGDRVAFTAVLSCGGSLVTYVWDYDGDGSEDEKGLLPLSGTGMDTLRGFFIYRAAGEFQAILRARDSRQQMSQGGVWVSVGGTGSLGLADLQVENATLSPEFSPDTYAYSARVHVSVSSIRFRALPNRGNAEVRVNGTWIASEVLSDGFPLELGENVFIIEVLNPGGETVSYTVSVGRHPSSVADLSQLFVIPGTLSPEFSSDITAYTVTVDRNQDFVNVFAYLPDGLQSRIYVDGRRVEAGWPSHDLSVPASGSIIRTVSVIAEDGFSLKIYRLTLMRSP